MESIQSTKSRLRAVGNVGKITKAMEVVSATKMRRAQEVALNSRAYAYSALHLLEKLAKNTPIKTEFTIERPIKNTCVVIVASDKGLTGSFNTQVFRAADKFLSSPEFTADNLSAIVIGKKSANYALKKKLNIVGSFYEVGDYVNSEEVTPLASLLTDGFKKREWDRVITISTHFRTALKQETVIRQVLPVDFKKIRETIKEIVPEHGRYSDIRDYYLNNNQKEEIDYIFEPSPKETINSLVPHLITMRIYHLILEANASEHSARRVAMKTASDNAENLKKELTLTFNKARQASITNELIEITSTQNALN